MLIHTPIDGLLIYQPKIYTDQRGFFVETYNQKIFKELGINNNWVQDNFSCSQKNVLRGLHFQKAPHEQAKLVYVTKGAAFDVAVDLRKNSKTFGKWFGVELNETNLKCVYIPKGFAHGFVSLSDTVHFNYKVDNFYHPNSDSGIAFDDTDINIEWPIAKKDLILSAKDNALPSFASFRSSV